jgi:hypothetical protein
MINKYRNTIKEFIKKQHSYTPQAILVELLSHKYEFCVDFIEDSAERIGVIKHLEFLNNKNALLDWYVDLFNELTIEGHYCVADTGYMRGNFKSYLFDCCGNYKFNLTEFANKHLNSSIKWDLLITSAKEEDILEMDRLICGFFNYLKDNGWSGEEVDDFLGEYLATYVGNIL